MIKFPRIDDGFFARLKNAVQCLKNSEHDIYFEAYPHFIHFFSSKQEISIQDFYVGAYFTYGWMPRIPKINLIDSEKILELLNQVKAKKELPIEELRQLQTTINGSIVGASKLLHFIRPDLYPIWDSNIAKHFHDEYKIHTYQVNDLNTYIDYFKFIHQVIQHEDFKKLFQNISSHFKYNISITPVRALEVTIFTFERNKKS
jgi:hypothetical protein